MWTSPRALILIHATADDATNFVGSGDLVEGLALEYDHVVTYQYRSGRPIAENANWLYNEVKRRAQPGFQTDVIGYSMGGLVARYFVERSKDDAARTALPNFNPLAPAGPLSGTVLNVITLGTPHRGGVDSRGKGILHGGIEPGRAQVPVMLRQLHPGRAHAPGGGTSDVVAAAGSATGSGGHSPHCDSRTIRAQPRTIAEPP